MEVSSTPDSAQFSDTSQTFSICSDVSTVAVFNSPLVTTVCADAMLEDSWEDARWAVLVVVISWEERMLVVTREESSCLERSLAWYSELTVLVQLGLGATGGGTFLDPDADLVFVALSAELILI